jgi:acetyl esterase/lipase
VLLTSIEPRPNSQVQAYLDSLEEPFPRLDHEIPDLRRTNQDLSVAGGGIREAVDSVEDVAIGSIPVRLYRPRNAESCALVWIHGGGWVVGDLASADAAARALANRSGSVVLSVDYRLAPEHRFPSGLEDCWAATVWASKRFKQVAVGGDSSGGNLAAAVALRARDAGLPLKLQLLVYPVLQPDTESPAYRDFAERYQDFAGKHGFGPAHQDAIRWIWDQYVPDKNERQRRDASPLLADHLDGIAPALIIVGEHDILRAECEAYARRLEDERVPVRLLSYEGQIHGFYLLLGLMDDARLAVKASGDALREAFSRKGPPGDRI